MTEYLWTSFVANDSGQNVLGCCSADGKTWQPNVNFNQASGFAPSLAFFNCRLYVAFIANYSGQNVLVCSSADGMSWEPLNGAGETNPDINQASGSAPSLAVFNGRLYVAFIANNSGQNVLVCSSADGMSWEPLNGAGETNPDINQASNGSAPSLAGFNGRLYVAFIANNSGQNVLVCSSADGKTFLPLNGAGETNPDINQASNGSAPSLAAFNRRLYVAFIANNSGQNVLLCSSADGETFLPLNGTGETNPDINQASNGSAPSLAAAPLSYWPVSATGLTSNSNYFFFRNNQAPISGISVTIALTEDMVFNAASGSNTGCTFQLNASSLDNPEQQYIIAYLNGEISGQINNWDNVQNQIFNQLEPLLSMPGGALPKYTVLTITPTTSANGIITGATFEAFIPAQPPSIPAQSATQSISIIPPTQLGPIVTFQLVIVGPDKSESAVLTSGAGTITFNALNGLTSQIGEPQFVEERAISTETANIFYSTLPSSSTPGNPFIQLFKVGSAPV